jgi:hypothetical protein
MRCSQRDSRSAERQCLGTAARAVIGGVADPGGRRGRRAVRAVSASVAVVAALLAVMAPSAVAQTHECLLLTNCTSVAGPWVVFSPLGPKPIPAGTSLACPDRGGLQLPVGSDYELDGPGPDPSSLDVVVTRFMVAPWVGLITDNVALFWAESQEANSSGAFRPHVGCIPQPKGQAAQQIATTAQAGATSVVRTRTTRLRPSRTVRGSHHCRRGERLVRGFAGVRFHRERPPTARELRDVTMTHRTRGRRVHARVRTGPTVGDHERVTLQILAVCAR